MISVTSLGRAICRSKPTHNDTHSSGAANRETHITEYVIPGDGFFAGCRVMIDPSLPPDTMEWRGKNTVRWNIKTGEIHATDV